VRAVALDRRTVQVLLVTTTEVPPIRLHDVRHGATSLAHEAGADLKTLQDLLGHSSIVITADTYTSVLPSVQRRTVMTPEWHQPSTEDEPQ
jgi:integrase